MLLDVTVGSLQVTCSRLGISLRRRNVLNCNASHSRVMNGNGTRHDIPNHPPKVARKRADGQFQVTLELTARGGRPICPSRTATSRSSRLRRPCEMSEWVNF